MTEEWLKEALTSLRLDVKALRDSVARIEQKLSLGAPHGRMGAVVDRNGCNCHAKDWEDGHG